MGFPKLFACLFFFWWLRGRNGSNHFRKWPRKILHISTWHVLLGLWYSKSKEKESKRAQIRKAIETHFALHNTGKDEAFICLSIRTGFDLFLKLLDLPQGSEVMMSAVTIPDMIKIVEAHGLVPVPVDVDIATMTPRIALLEKARSHRTKVLVLAHIFDRFDVSPFVEFAKENSIILVEDCAQVFCGWETYTGHSQADISMFSFGTIKTSTANGAAILKIKDQALLKRMKEAALEYPIVSRGKIIKKVILNAAVFYLTWFPIVYGSFIYFLENILGGNFDKFIIDNVRGFSGGDFFSLIRKQPAYGTMALLHNRLKNTDTKWLQRRKANGMLMDKLLDGKVEVVGRDCLHKSYWCYTIVVSNPAKLMTVLRRAGFDATQGASQLTWVKIPSSMSAERAKQLDPVASRKAWTNLIYLPVIPEMSEWWVRLLADVVIKHAMPLDVEGLSHDRAYLSFPLEGESSVQTKRRRRLQTLREEEFDIVVVGGGIGGAGVARDAVLRGLKVALLEPNDFASPPSYDADKLLRSGLPVLNGTISVTRRINSELKRAQKLFPAYVTPLDCAAPVFEGGKSSVSSLGWTYWFYDLCQLWEHKHQTTNGAQTQCSIPTLISTKGKPLMGAQVTKEFQIDDSRFTVSNISSAERNGAVALNYVTFKSAELANGKVVGATVEDSFTRQSLHIKCEQVIFTQGEQSNEKHACKTVHICVPRGKLPVDKIIVLEYSNGKERCCVSPWFEVTIISANSILSVEDQREFSDVVTKEEVLYLLAAVNENFANHQISDDDIHCTWTGLKSTQKYEEPIKQANGITHMEVQRLATYRAVAEDVVNCVSKELLKKDKKGYTHVVKDSLARIVPFDGPPILDDPSQAADELTKHLFYYRGRPDVAWIQARIALFPAEAKRVVPSLPFIYAEVSHAVLMEHAVHVDDVLMRRTSIFFRDENQGLYCSGDVARHMARLANNNEDWITAEVKRYSAIVAASRMWRLD